MTLQDMYDSRSLEEETPETRSASAKQLKETRLLHDALSSFFPSSFDHKDVQTPYYESHEDSSAHALLKIEPDITNTWFCPTPRYATDTIGYWPEAAKLPPGKRCLLPPDSKKTAPPRAPSYTVVDTELRKMLEAPQMDKVFLEPLVFETTTTSVRKSPHALLDSHLRTGLLEHYTTDAYLRIILDLTKCLSGKSTTVPHDEALDLLPRVVKQAARSNSRAGYSQVAAYTCNKIALRDQVLHQFKEPNPRTGEVLRGSNLLGERLFGPIPESFTAVLNSDQGRGLRCVSKGSYRKTPASSASRQWSSRAVPGPPKRRSSGPLPPLKRFQEAAPLASSRQSFPRGRGSQKRRPGKFQ